MGVVLYTTVAAMAVFLYFRRTVVPYLMARGKTEPLPFVPKAASVAGKRVVVVGGTKGIGLSLAKRFSRGGASVTVVGRTDPKVEGIAFVAADLSTVKAQRALVASLEDPARINVVLFTQGIFAPHTYQDNGEGIELDLAVSSISRRVLFDGLVARGFRGRTFVMGYPGQEIKVVNWNMEDKRKPYGLMDQHFNTIVTNEALVLGARTRHPELEIYGLNPGLVATDIRGNVYSGSFKYLEPVLEALIGFLFPSSDQYASDIWHVVSAEALPKSVYAWNLWGEAVARPQSLTQQLVEDLWAKMDAVIATVPKQ